MVRSHAETNLGEISGRLNNGMNETEPFAGRQKTEVSQQEPLHDSEPFLWIQYEKGTQFQPFSDRAASVLEVSVAPYYSQQWEKTPTQIGGTFNP